jgi:type 1 glutamine amidotransferase
MSTRVAAVLVVTMAVFAVAPLALAQSEPPRILFFSRSEGFEHGPVAVKDSKPSVAEKALGELAAQESAPFKSTKDGGEITAENLKKYDLVVFYTQGDITKPESKDGAPPVSAQGINDLLDWVKNGGRYMGFHSASDTMHTPKGGEVTPYLKMVGGEFIGHGPQFVGAVKVVDPTHPAMASIPQDWSFLEEWYTFSNFNKDSIRVLALLHPDKEIAAKDKRYDSSDYPIIWVNTYGKGKVYFNAIGHREELWESNPVFRASILDAAKWLMADGTEGFEPNFDKVVPKEKAADKPVEKK